MAKNEEPTSTPEGILVRLKNKLCLETKIDTFTLRTLIDKFVSTTLQGEVSSKAHFAKVNIYNELTSSKMTIKVFFKFLRILNLKKIKFAITVTTLKDTEYSVFEEVNLFTQRSDDHDDKSV